jgi:hypothetical protein
VTIHHTIEAREWRALRVTVRHGKLEATCDGEPLASDSPTPVPSAGWLAFFVGRDGVLEISDARIRALPE